MKRNFDEAYLERVRAYHATEAFAKAMRKRQVWVEPLFAEGKAWHGGVATPGRAARPASFARRSHPDWP